MRDEIPDMVIRPIAKDYSSRGYEIVSNSQLLQRSLTPIREEARARRWAEIPRYLEPDPQTSTAGRVALLRFAESIDSWAKGVKATADSLDENFEKFAFDRDTRVAFLKLWEDVKETLPSLSETASTLVASGDGELREVGAQLQRLEEQSILREVNEMCARLKLLKAKPTELLKRMREFEGTSYNLSMMLVKYSDTIDTRCGLDSAVQQLRLQIDRADRSLVHAAAEWLEQLRFGLGVLVDVTEVRTLISNLRDAIPLAILTGSSTALEKITQAHSEAVEVIDSLHRDDLNVVMLPRGSSAAFLKRVFSLCDKVTSLVSEAMQALGPDRQLGSDWKQDCSVCFELCEKMVHLDCCGRLGSTNKICSACANECRNHGGSCPFCRSALAAESDPAITWLADFLQVDEARVARRITLDRT